MKTEIKTPDLSITEIEEKVSNALTKVAYDMEAEAKRLCPVDTGRLRNSINIDIQGTKIIISANTNYAQYVEFGTYKQHPQPYIRPALYKALSFFINKRFKEEFGG